MLVFPAVDIYGGRCVRLVQGRPGTGKVYYDDPCEAAARWVEEGAEALHVVDLDGALGSGSNRDVVLRLLGAAQVPVQVAGGIRTEGDVQALLEGGAARVVVGTRAVQEPQWVARLCEAHPGRVVVALDARQGRVAVSGWRRVVDAGPVELARALEAACPAAFLYTDVARDGMLTSPNFKGVRRLRDAVGVPVIASGGVSSLEHLRRLGECGADGVIIGKALYEGRLRLAEALAEAARFGSRLSARP